MKRPLLPLLALTLLLAGPSLSGAEKAAAAPAKSAATASVAGQFAGSWKSDAEGLGDLRLKLRQDEGKWLAESSFTFEGAEIPTRCKSVEIDGMKVVMVFDWEIQGTAGQSKLTGELVGEKFQGKYEVSGPIGNSTGTWNATRK